MRAGRDSQNGTARAPGLPVVAVNHSLNQEILGTTGLFVQKDNAEALAEALSSVLFYPREQKKWGSKTRKRVRAHFTWQRVLEEYLTVYHYPFVRRVPVDSIQAIVPKELLA
ncbi:MAG: glycosyltransferase [Candidatus Andersenbacteria bacterium]|nr:glycosyltransferase [Candidatus Andersenbacteria bacterium]